LYGGGIDGAGESSKDRIEGEGEKKIRADSAVALGAELYLSSVSPHSQKSLMALQWLVTVESSLLFPIGMFIAGLWELDMVTGNGSMMSTWGDI
jgi:hypothetical protein